MYDGTGFFPMLFMASTVLAIIVRCIRTWDRCEAQDEEMLRLVIIFDDINKRGQIYYVQSCMQSF